MAIEKGAKVTRRETKELMLLVKQPNGSYRAVAEAKPAVDGEMLPEDVEHVWTMAKEFKRGGFEHKVIERVTKIRTQVIEKEVTQDE